MNATITLRSACAGSVHIAVVKVGRKVIYETRAWGTTHNALCDAKQAAAQLGFTVAKIK